MTNNTTMPEASGRLTGCICLTDDLTSQPLAGYHNMPNCPYGIDAQASSKGEASPSLIDQRLAALMDDPWVKANTKEVQSVRAAKVREAMVDVVSAAIRNKEQPQ